MAKIYQEICDGQTDGQTDENKVAPFSRTRCCMIGDGRVLNAIGYARDQRYGHWCSSVMMEGRTSSSAMAERSRET